MFKYPILIVGKKDNEGMKNSVGGGGGTDVSRRAQGHHVL